MPGPGVVFAEDWMMNDRCCHTLSLTCLDPSLKTVRYRNGALTFPAYFAWNSVCQGQAEDQGQQCTQRKVQGGQG